MRWFFATTAGFVFLLSLGCDRQPKIPSGRFYYITTVARCDEIQVRSDGKLARATTGFCGTGSLFERSPGGGLTLTCLDHQHETQPNQTRVYDVESVLDGLSLSWNGEPYLMLYNTLGGCESLITDEKREKARLEKAREHYNLGIALNDKGQFDEAIAAYRKAIELNPNDAADYRNSLASALARKRQMDP